MKMVLSLVLVFGFVACSSAKKDEAASKDCAVCAGSESKADCKCEDHKAGQSCEHGTSCKDQHGSHGSKGHEATALPAEAWTLDQPHMKQRITQHEFQTALGKSQEKLNKSCVAPAQKYCGKTTKDMAVTESEVVCLYTKVHRVTREKLPQLDGTPCAKLIKGMTASKK
ncbi:MAG: hypothetical protein K2P92_00605 [Bdellovibrionaceae bacterium]|nr:hypothetical protein [Pseudobdellovibrionaceae bacterium]